MRIQRLNGFLCSEVPPVMSDLLAELCSKRSNVRTCSGIGKSYQLIRTKDETNIVATDIYKQSSLAGFVVQKNIILCSKHELSIFFVYAGAIKCVKKYYLGLFFW